MAEKLQVIHITPSTNGYELVNLVANRVSRKNHLALIEKDGTESMTGGLLFEDTEQNRNLLDSIPRENQYEFMMGLRRTPYVKMYADE